LAGLPSKGHQRVGETPPMPASLPGQNIDIARTALSNRRCPDWLAAPPGGLRTSFDEIENFRGIVGVAIVFDTMPWCPGYRPVTIV
jgi:hypothetical protein